MEVFVNSNKTGPSRHVNRNRPTGRLPVRLALGVCLVALVGCDIAKNSNPRVTMNAEGSVIYTETGKLIELDNALINTVSIVDGTPLSNLASNLDAVATTRSPAVHDLRASQAQLQAKRYEWLPIIKPSATLPLKKGGQPAVGLTIEQVLWDGGRVRSGISIAEYQVVNAALTAWIDRNQAVHDGLAAYVEMSRFRSRLLVLKGLQEELHTLNDLLQTRESGGVADRGELLRMGVALQEVQRESLSNEAEYRKAETELAQMLSGRELGGRIDVSEPPFEWCQRHWPSREFPATAISRFKWSQREANEAEMKARLWPRIVASAATSYVTGGTVKPTASLALDSEDLLGLGRRANIAAAEANTESAKGAYNLQVEEARVELSRLEADYRSMVRDLAQMTALEKGSLDSLALYDEQMQSGTIPVTEGITLYREVAESRLAQANIRTDIFANCLRISQIRGTLTPFSIESD